VRITAAGGRALMLVSARADEGLRAAVREGRRPDTEFLYLERAHDVDLLDWSQLPFRPSLRSQAASVQHALAALPRLHRYGVVFSDGENVGIPLALALRGLGSRIPHLVLGHHLSSPRKRRYFRTLAAGERMSRVLVHSALQAELASTDLRIPRERLAVLPYCVDTDFWSPGGQVEENLIVSAGREHRDYATLAAATGGLPVRVQVAAGSLHTPEGTWSAPPSWPSNFSVRPLDYLQLREAYRRAALVVIPVLETDFQAGITSVLEAMAVGCPVITSATAGRSEAIEDGVNGVLVPPGDAAALGAAVTRLIGDPGERRRLGARARETAVQRHRIGVFGDALARHLDELAQGARRLAVAGPARDEG